MTYKNPLQTVKPEISQSIGLVSFLLRFFQTSAEKGRKKSSRDISLWLRARARTQVDPLNGQLIVFLGASYVCEGPGRGARARASNLPTRSVGL